MTDLHKAIQVLHQAIVIEGNSQDDMVAKDSDGNEIDIDWDAVNSWVDPEEYINQRLKEYPLLAEQLDYIYHNGVEAWKTDIIDPIKQRYPKP